MRIFVLFFSAILTLGSYSLLGQSELQRRITGSINGQKLTVTEPLLLEYALMMEKESSNPTADSVFYFYSKARYLFEAEQQIEREERFLAKYNKLDAHFDFLTEAFHSANTASSAYARLDEKDQSMVRKSITATDGEVKEHLKATIEKTAFELIKNAQYRKPTRQLYQSRIYHKTVDADTLMALREALFDQCSRFIQEFEGSNYSSSVEEFRKELLSEYSQLETVRQYGEKSGEKYEKYCSSILALFPSEEIDHILPTFYGAEFGWGNKNWSSHPNFQKLKEVAVENQLTPLEFLCELSLHSEGCHDGNRHLYVQLIEALAPEDIALVLVQKILSPYVYSNQLQKAQEVIDRFRGLFSSKSRYFDQLETLLSTEDERILTNLGPSVNSRAQEFYPVLTLDEKRLYFARKTVEYGEDIFISYQFNDDDWLPAEQVPSNLNTSSHELPLGISADGNMLLLYGNYSILPNFAYLRNQERRLGKGDFYYTHRIGRGWGRVEVFKYPINTPNYEAGISLSANGNALFFASDREGAVGGYNPIYHPEYLYYHGGAEFNLDIYVSIKDEEGNWGEPVNLGENLNTPFAEKNPFIHPDGNTLYFSSNGHYGLGGYDIFMCKRKNPDSWTEWTEPVNVGKAINSPYDDSFYMSATGRRALLVSNREGDNFGKTDIYWVEVPKKYRPDPIIVVSGKIVDDEGKPLETEITWETVSTPKEVGTIKNHPEDGTFMFALKPGKKYRYFPKKDDFFSNSLELDLIDKKESEVLPVAKITMSSIDLANKERKPFVLKTLRFDFDSDVIRPESYFDLDRVVQLLNDHPTYKLSIEGHTDHKGSHDFNMNLSERRTASVKKYLMEKGIAENRLKNQGFGETMPIATNETEEGRQLNRRVEFRVN